MKSVNEKDVNTLHQQINDITAAKENDVQNLRQELNEISINKNCIEQEWNKSEQCNKKNEGTTYDRTRSNIHNSGNCRCCGWNVCYDRRGAVGQRN